MKKFLAVLTVSALALSGCSAMGSEKDRYIDAVTDATCLIFGSADILDPALEEQTKAIFADNGFDVDDEEAMIELAEKYDADTDVQAAIEGALEECAGEFLDAFNAVGQALDEGKTLDEVESEMATEDATASE